MFKRVRAFIFAVILVALTGQVWASAAGQNNVKDFLNYLKEDEAVKLQTEIDKVKADHGLDVVVVITDDTEGKSSMAYADDYYDYNGYGVGDDYSGLLMLVNMKEREVWISTTGKAIDIFTDSRISTMVDHVTKYLSDGKYYDACRTFIGDVVNYATKGVPSGQYREELKTVGSRSYFDKVLDMMKSFPVYIIAFIFSIVATIIASLSSKGKVTINSSTYEGGGSFVLSGSRDDYIREFTTRTKIESSSSGGRSSTHSGSSGRSHGGGGGRF